MHSTDATDWSYTPSGNSHYTVTKFNFTPNEPPEEVEEAVNAGWCKGTLLPHPRMPFVHVCVVCGMEVSDREIALNVKAEMTPYARFDIWKRIHQVRNKPFHPYIPGTPNESGYRTTIKTNIVSETARAIENHRWLTDAHKDPRSERTLWRIVT